MEAWVCSSPEAWELSVFLAGTGWDLNNFCGIDLSSMSQQSEGHHPRVRWLPPTVMALMVDKYN